MSTDSPNGRPSMDSGYSNARANPRLSPRYEGRHDPSLGYDRTAVGTESTFSLEELLRVLRRRFWAIILTAIVLVGAATGFSLIQTPTYEASISILVGQEANSGPSENLSNDVQGLQQLTATMAKAVSTLPVAQTVTERLNMPPGSTEDLLDT